MKKIGFIVPFLVLSACATGPSGANLQGKIFCDNCAPLEKGAIVRVQLLDSAIADAPAQILSEQIIQGPQSFPIKYKMHYWDSQIKLPDFTGVFVTIRQDGKLIYWTDTNNAPFANGAKPKSFDVKLAKAN